MLRGHSIMSFIGCVHTTICSPTKCHQPLLILGDRAFISCSPFCNINFWKGFLAHQNLRQRWMAHPRKMRLKGLIQASYQPSLISVINILGFSCFGITIRCLLGLLNSRQLFFRVNYHKSPVLKSWGLL